MSNLLVVGVDSTLTDTFTLAEQVFDSWVVKKVFLPSEDYYNFDVSSLYEYSPNEWKVFVAVNEFYINDVRRALCEAVFGLGFEPVSIISPRATIGRGVVIGKNVLVSPGCYIGESSTLGDSCVLRANVVLADNVTLGRYVMLEANVSIRELCTVGDFTTVCANSSLARGTSIGNHCYLNLPRMYTGVVQSNTFYSPSFENPVRVISN